MIDAVKQIWTLSLKALTLAVILFAFLSVIELLRVYLFFQEIHPMLALGYAISMGALLIGVVLYFRRHLGPLPKVLVPPVLGDIEQASFKSLKRFVKYQGEYLARLKINQKLSESGRDQAGLAIRSIQDVLSAHPLRDDLQRLIVQTHEKAIGPLLEELHHLASKEVRASVRDVMLAVTLSPYRVIDLLVVLYRNGGMVVRIAQIYESRPGLRAQLRILHDTLRVVITVNFINLSRNLVEGIFSRIPLVGRVVEDIGEGIGAGFFTSLAGHAAIDRCSAYQGWQYEEAIQGIGRQSRQFLDDVRDSFMRDVFPQLQGRIRMAGRARDSALDENKLLDTVSGAVLSAFDASARTVNALLVKPAVSGTQAVFRGGSRLLGQDKEEPHRPQASRRRRRSTRNGPFRLLKIFGQRIRYGTFGPGTHSP